MAITDKDVDKLKKVFATKDDLKKFVTKEDFEKFKNEFFTGQDYLIKKVETVLQETRVTFGQYKPVLLCIPDALS